MTAKPPALCQFFRFFMVLRAGRGALRDSRVHGEIVPNGGWGGIRTPGGHEPTPVFKTGALNHSATHPCLVSRRAGSHVAGLSCENWDGGPVLLPYRIVDKLSCPGTSNSHYHHSTTFSWHVPKFATRVGLPPYDPVKGSLPRMPPLLILNKKREGGCPAKLVRATAR